MTEHKTEKTEEQIRHLAGEFMARESNRTSLVTVTNVRLFSRGSKAVIFITVLPEDKQDEALEFVKRKRTDFREYIKEHTRLQRLPFVDFEIDFGEKNRQRIDELSNVKE